MSSGNFPPPASANGPYLANVQAALDALLAAFQQSGLRKYAAIARVAEAVGMPTSRALHLIQRTRTQRISAEECERTLLLAADALRRINEEGRSRFDARERQANELEARYQELFPSKPNGSDPDAKMRRRSEELQDNLPARTEHEGTAVVAAAIRLLRSHAASTRAQCDELERQADELHRHHAVAKDATSGGSGQPCYENTCADAPRGKVA